MASDQIQKGILMPKVKISAETQITRTYTCRIIISNGIENFDKIAAYGFKKAFKRNVDYETFQGCPASEAYIEVSSESCEDIHKWRKAIVSYLKRFKGMEINV